MNTTTKAQRTNKAKRATGKPILDALIDASESLAADKSAHTPGPWISRRTYTNGEPQKMAVTSGARFICNVDGGLNEEENEANARLVAAAPDLLKIAQEIANSQCDLGNSERRIRLYSAIQKAGGDL